MRTIGIIKDDKIKSNSFFNIDKYYFSHNCESKDIKYIFEHFISINLNKGTDYQYGDLVNILRDIDKTPIEGVTKIASEINKNEVWIKWLTEVPKETHEYIKEYELEIKEYQQTLFSDFKKRYLEICKCDNLDVDIDIAMIGYTLIDNKFEIKIKAFNYKVLEKICNKIINQFNSNDFIIDSENLRWHRIKDFVVSNYINSFQSEVTNKLLESTLKDKFKDLFIFLFKEIDVKGYVDLVEQSGDDDNNKIKRMIKTKSQIKGFLKPYLKLNINNQFLYIHDDPSLNIQDELNNRVFSFPSRLMQYYELNWFEEYVGKVLEAVKTSDFEIIEMIPNRIYNFYNDQISEHNIEIDWLLNVKFQGQYRIVGVECKKTLKRSYYNKTKDKIKNKIIKSNNDIIDGYLVIGFFVENNFKNALESDNIDIYKPEYLIYETESDLNNIVIPYIITHGTGFEQLKERVEQSIKLINYDSL